ncbi:tRNA (adenosine(37)-N6)-threonylcarbamoyltransferase complex dimerization subunit type 1 TsaB [Actinotalea sp.]|uniref:tRNA (adenosine(37)-N6)-threonylcarbamoyltransferase complex dimerization subunit type 1 TsaB n=1 Tax=Actinotalea sp. TaxID=1872145 RepID=UPI00356331DD
MPVLCLDTSAEIAVCLLADDGSVLARRQVAEQRRHAELLGPMITSVLSDAGVDRLAVSAVAVGTGPAPFTGLRAGLVTARTLAFALGVPAHGVCSLDVLAAQAFAAGLHGEVLVVTDARRREVYAARYRAASAAGASSAGLAADLAADLAEVEVVVGPSVDHPAALAGQSGSVVGPGALLYPDELPAAEGAPVVLDVAVLGRLAIARAARGVEQPTAPLYLRRPDVTPSASRKRATG